MGSIRCSSSSKNIWAGLGYEMFPTLIPLLLKGHLHCLSMLFYICSDLQEHKCHVLAELAVLGFTIKQDVSVAFQVAHCGYNAAKHTRVQAETPIHFSHINNHLLFSLEEKFQHTR